MNDQYSQQGYILLKQFIPPDMAMYFREYMNTLLKTGVMTEGDAQVGLSSCVYGDPAMDTFMLMSTSMISRIIGIQLLPTYTYARIYHHGAELLPHLDRPECEHSMSISFGGEHESLWPMWLMDNTKHQSPQMAVLEPGDAVVYQGTKLHHWRDKFEGQSQYQAFLHFVDAQGAYVDKLYDSRPYIGMTASTKR